MTILTLKITPKSITICSVIKLLFKALPVKCIRTLKISTLKYITTNVMSTLYKYMYTSTTYVAVMPYGETPVNIGSGHGMMPDSTKPPLGPTLTSHHRYRSTLTQAMAFHLTAPSHHPGPMVRYHYMHISTMSQTMACHRPVPSHHLSQCWNNLCESTGKHLWQFWYKHQRYYSLRSTWLIHLTLAQFPSCLKPVSTTNLKKCYSLMDLKVKKPCHFADISTEKLILSSVIWK